MLTGSLCASCLPRKLTSKIRPVNCPSADQIPATLTFLLSIPTTWPLHLWFLLPGTLFHRVFIPPLYGPLFIPIQISVQSSPPWRASPPWPWTTPSTYPPTRHSVTQWPALFASEHYSSLHWSCYIPPACLFPLGHKILKAGTLLALLSVGSDAEWVLNKYLRNEWMRWKVCPRGVFNLVSFVIPNQEVR